MESKPLSKRKRYFYLSVCVIAFFILSPIVAMYATGYRFGDKYEVMKTGGMYIVTQAKDFNVLVDNVPQKSSSIFRRNFLVQDIKPNTYDVKVTKDGFMSWTKKVVVYPEKVNEMYPFNLPETIDMIEIPKTVMSPVFSNGTTTLKKKETENKEFVYVKNLFFATTTKDVLIKNKISNTTSTLDQATSTVSRKKIAIENIANEIFVEWFGDEDSIPLYFCDLDKCLKRMSIYKGENINRSELFLDRNDLVIFSTKDGIYVTETDGRGGRNIQPIVMGDYDFRIDEDGTLYLKKDDKTFYRVDLKS